MKFKKSSLKSVNIIFFIVWILLITGNVKSQTVSYTKNDYVKLVSNTFDCVTDCETVYKVCALDKDIKINDKETYFKYKDSKDSIEKDIIKNLNVQYLISSKNLISKTCDNIQCIDNNSSTKNAYSNQTCVNTPFDCSYYEESYIPLYSKTIIPLGTCENIKIKGNKQANKAIDNILNLNIGTEKYSYPEYAWWNTSFQSCRNITIANPVINQEFRLNINTPLLTDVNNSNGDFASLRIVDGGCGISGNPTENPFFIEKWNLTGNSSIWIDTKSTNTTIALYYNNESAQTSLKHNLTNTFLFGDEFSGAGAGWTNENNLVFGQGTANVSGTPASYVYKDLNNSLTYPFEVKYQFYRATAFKNPMVAPVTYGTGGWGSVRFNGVGLDEAVENNVLQMLEQNVAWRSFGQSLTTIGTNIYVDIKIDVNKNISARFYANTTSIGSEPAYVDSPIITNTFNEKGIQLISLPGQDFVVPYIHIFTRNVPATETTVTSISAVDTPGSPPPPSETSSCTYVSGVWTIQGSEACGINSTSLGGQNIIFNGTGQIRILQSITGCGVVTLQNGVDVTVTSGARLC